MGGRERGKCIERMGRRSEKNEADKGGWRCRKRMSKKWREGWRKEGGKGECGKNER